MLHFTQSLKKELSFYGFEPVNLVTGSVLYEGIDCFFPGALPLEWKRVYHSDSNFKGALGIGVHSLADMKLFLYPQAQCIGLLLADGRVCGFDYVEEGEVDFCRVNRLELRKHPKGYEVYDLEKRLFYNFEYFNRVANSYLLTSVTDLDGRSIRLSYENGVLATLTDACGRRITVRHTDAGFIESLHLRMPDGSSEQLVRYSYDGQGDMVGITDALRQTTGIHYEDHRMVAKTDRNGTRSVGNTIKRDAASIHAEPTVTKKVGSPISQSKATTPSLTPVVRRVHTATMPISLSAPSPMPLATRPAMTIPRRWSPTGK